MKTSLAGISILILCVGSVQGSIVEIQPTRSSESSIAEILSSYYGGDFELSGADLLGSGDSDGISAIRIDDYLDPMGVLNVDTSFEVGDAADAFWMADEIELTPIARYAGWNQRLGIDRGEGSEWLYTETSRGMLSSSSFTVDLGGEMFTWVRDSGNGSNTSSSDPSENSDGEDHFVAYQIVGLDDVPTWIVGVEDTLGSRSDRDFNDLVFRVRAVPEPAMIAFFALGGVALILRR